MVIRVFWFFLLSVSFILISIASFSQKKDTLNLYFDVNKYDLNVYHRVELNSLLDKYSEVTYISISGYADTTGSVKYNLELSRKRAVSVKNYLFTIGLDTLIRDFNYYGEGRAGLPVMPTHQLSSKGSAVLNDRRVETIAGGKPIDMVFQSTTIKTVPEPVIANDNIPPVVTVVKMPLKDMHAKLQNNIELDYYKGAFSDYVDNKIAHGDESVIKLIETPDDLKLRNMVTVTMNGTYLSPAAIVCFDSLTFNHLVKDTSIEMKIPLNSIVKCPAGVIRLYSGYTAGGIWKWMESPEKFTIEKNDGDMRTSIEINSFDGCLNFAYPIEAPCFHPAKSILKLKDITILSIRALISSLNCSYIPEKKEENTYEIFQNQDGTSIVLLDFAARDNNNKTYSLTNFPISLCKYEPETKTYLLTKKDLKKFLKKY